VTYPRRDIIDAIRYLAHNGCVWRALPVDFPPWPLVRHYFTVWTPEETLNRIHNALRERVGLVEGRAAQPSAALVDSQSVRGADTVGRPSRGYDAGTPTPTTCPPRSVPRATAQPGRQAAHQLAGRLPACLHQLPRR
jgi:transposase